MRSRPLVRLLSAAVAIACLVGCTPTVSSDTAGGGGTSNSAIPVATPVRSPHPSHKPRPSAKPPTSPKAHPRGVPSADVPNPALTPGVALHVGASRICVPGYSTSVRNVPDSEKTRVYARYHVAWVPYQHEVDHLISLELGGSNAITNLWPEPYAGRWGARTKDVLENRLHDLVCSGQLSLRSAQYQESTNWVAAYHRYVGATPPGSGSGGAGTSPGGYYASRYPSASTIYCADDPEWKSLSKTYLVHFMTFAVAHARFPSYHLHQPC